MGKIIVRKGDNLHFNGRPCVVTGFFTGGDFIEDLTQIKISYTDGQKPEFEGWVYTYSFDEYTKKPTAAELVERLRLVSSVGIPGCSPYNSPAAAANLIVEQEAEIERLRGTLRKALDVVDDRIATYTRKLETENRGEDTAYALRFTIEVLSEWVRPYLLQPQQPTEAQ